MSQFDNITHILSQQDPKLISNHFLSCSHIDNYQKNQRRFSHTQEVTRQQFDVILKDVRKNYRITEKKRLSQDTRQRNIGAGRKFDLDVKDRLVMLLVYYRMYLTYDLTGHLFGLDQSNVSRNIRYLEPAVKQSIPIPAKLYVDSKKINSLQQFQEFFPELIVITRPLA